MTDSAPPTEDAIRKALDAVLDPEIRRPITELGMVRSVEIADDGAVTVGIDLTVGTCPMRGRIESDVRAAVEKVDGVTSAAVALGVMTDQQRAELRSMLRGGAPEPVIPFTQPGNLTRVYCVTSGKGGVGKSSITANVGAAMAKQGLKVGIVDADIYGFSIPRMMGVENPPTKVDDMILPPVAHDVKVISIGMFAPPGQPIVWRGPMLHRALQQFLSEVYWGDLDVLLLDLPPGTGDMAISVAQLLPGSEIVVVTTPQVAAAEVAERAGLISGQTEQRVVGVVENMAWLEQEDGSKLEIFGSGGGQRVAQQLSERLGYEVPLLAQVPLQQSLREHGDEGTPISIVEGDAIGTAGKVLADLAHNLGHRARGLAGRNLGVKPN